MFWPSTPWKATVSGVNQNRKLIDLSLPYALIGSHSDCQIHIPDDGVPELAYLALAFENEMEVWPLAGNGSDQCVVLDASRELKLGKSSVRLMLSPNRDSVKIQKIERPLVLQATFNGKTIDQPLVRRVLILGEGNSANLRFQNAGLACYDQAIVSAGNTVWMISLRPCQNPPLRGREKGEREDGGQVRVLRNSRDSVRVGKIVVSLQRDDPGLYLPVPMNHKQVVSQVTERLVSKSQWRWKRKAVIHALLGTTLFVASMSIVFWMIAKVILPMVSEIQG